MAVVQYTGIVNQVRGKLNGSVFNKARNANTLQRKQQQTAGAKGFQSEIRNVFSDVQRQWKDATPQERNDWQEAANNNPSRDRFGNPTILSGYNQYVKANIFRWYAIGQILGFVNPLPAAASPYTAFFINILAFSALATGRVECTFEFSVEGAGDFSNSILLIDVSLPISRGVTTYYKRYSFVYGNGSIEPGVVAGSIDLGTKYPLPRATQRVIARMRVVDVGNGAVTQEFFDDIIYS